jgi:hypothetical protein
LSSSGKLQTLFCAHPKRLKPTHRDERARTDYEITGVIAGRLRTEPSPFAPTNEPLWDIKNTISRLPEHPPVILRARLPIFRPALPYLPANSSDVAGRFGKIASVV